MDRRLPRTRGDGPVRHRRCSKATARAPASPHTRGWTPTGSRDRHRCAEASWRLPRTRGDGPVMSHRLAHQRSTAGLPRTRGDGPASTSGSFDDFLQASPHTRGWTRGASSAALEAKLNRLPRTRGDGPSPCWTSDVRPRRLPRTRGDGPLTDLVIVTVNLVTRNRPGHRSESPASPHTRGWTRRETVTGNVYAGTGFPAHAGMDPIACRWVG